MKTRLFRLLIRLLYRNLSKNEYGCETCKESAKRILQSIGAREKFTIHFNPGINAFGNFESYHIRFES